ncbi:MAG: glycosyltransferase [Candidatus Goldbacteria bacterium]|nr:glycosyltransferase [Candidatus Goldiibacteriota bacterium]
MKSVAIIIPVKKINDYVFESLSCIEKINYDKKLINVIILPDEEENVNGNYSFRIKTIPTGSINPGKKRDIGIKNTESEIIAFIDDDVYPDVNWLMSAVAIFENDKEVAAVGGPAVTPENDSFSKKVSGYIYSSFLGGGGCRYRYIPRSRREVDDFPSCNLIIRKDVLEKIGGFNTEFWPGEDTVICLKIVKDLKMKIIYDPDVLVYHHRRDFPLGHLRQVINYATHRGYFVKKFPETSFRLSYFVPTFFLLYLVSFILPVFFLKKMMVLWTLPLIVYLLLLFIDGIKLKRPKTVVLTMAGIFITHVAYGIYFVFGLLSKKLTEENNGSIK